MRGPPQILTHAPGPSGTVPFTEDFLINGASGDHFGMTQNAGMGWNPVELLRKQFVILSTAGGLQRAGRGACRTRAAHRTLRACDDGARRLAGAAGAESLYRSRCSALTRVTVVRKGTTGMLDSLPYRNDAAQVFRRQARSLPTSRGVLGVASCDKGLPAMMMALAGLHDMPVVVVPGGVTLAPEHGEDTGMIQSIGASDSPRVRSRSSTPRTWAAEHVRPQVEAASSWELRARPKWLRSRSGLAITHGALSPSGNRRLAGHRPALGTRALVMSEKRGVTSQDILTDAAFENAMVVHAACGGSTNLLLHTPAIAHAAGQAAHGRR